MAQITLNSSGVASNGSLVLQTNGTTTAATFDTSQKLTLPNDATISGLTVGKGGGAVSTNTAVGYQAAYSNVTGSTVTAFGYKALYANTGNNNVGLGESALVANTTGTANVGVGVIPLGNNTTGSYNTAVGQESLRNNTTASNNTAVGYQAGYSQTGTNNTYLGYQAGYTTTSQGSNTFIGYKAGYAHNPSDGYTTCVGSQAGQAITSGNYNTLIGSQAGIALTTGSSNCFVGANGTYASGQLMTTGSKNTILGSFSGNNGGLDIRTSSNNVVLSDGDGNPRGLFISGGWFKVQGDGSYQDTAGLYHEFSSAQNNQAFIVACSSTGSSVVGIRSKLPAGASASAKFYLAELSGTGTVFQVISNGNVQNTNNSYGAISDVKLKENIVDATPKLADMMKVQIRNYNLKSDPQHKQIGVIAQELEQVFPSMVEETADTDSEGNDLGTTTKSVKYSVFVPMLIKSIQELKALVDAQATEIAELKGK